MMTRMMMAMVMMTLVMLTTAATTMMMTMMNHPELYSNVQYETTRDPTHGLGKQANLLIKLVVKSNLYI